MAARKRAADKQHRWLSQVEVTGVVLSEPVLAEDSPAGFRPLDKKELAAFYKAREVWNLPAGMAPGDVDARWVDFILNDMLRLKASYWKVGADIPPQFTVSMPEQRETLRPSRVLMDGDTPVMLFLQLPRKQDLDRNWVANGGGWKASPTTKLERLLRDTKVEVGLLTNGESWRLVAASPSETASWITWTDQYWADSPSTLSAFVELLGEARTFAGPRESVLLELIRKSRLRQVDVAEELGRQTREALRIFIHEIDRVDEGVNGALLRGYSEEAIFDAGIAFVMRLVFMLYAEENRLLPHGNVGFDQAYGMLHLLTELEHEHRLEPDKLRHSYEAYSRLLATCRLIHQGSVDPDIPVAEHAGSLFDPKRYPLLEGRSPDGSLPPEPDGAPRIRDDAMRQILRGLKYARVGGVTQLVSYRTLSVEQIGHMYEGLLDRKVARAPVDEALFLLQGTNKEPEPIVSEKEIADLCGDPLAELLAKRTGRSLKSTKEAIEATEEQRRLPNLDTEDAGLVAKATPLRPLLVDRGIVRRGGIYLTRGQDRRSQGAHYTPPTLTAPIVRRTLEHMVYECAAGKPGLILEPRRVQPPEVILGLKVCDPAMGSGAFLVQTVRYLSDRLVDSWESRTAEYPEQPLAMPFAQPSTGNGSELLLPESREERLVYARRYVAERCVYGVDRNAHAVEMAKLSLWITTLSAGRPFSFLDHSLKHGDSLVGLDAEQIKAFTWEEVPKSAGPLFAAVESTLSKASDEREAIHALPDHAYHEKETGLEAVNSHLVEIRLIGDLLISAFFSGEKKSEREATKKRAQLEIGKWKAGKSTQDGLTLLLQPLQLNHISPFHWHVEFPEIFSRVHPGFDAVVGNPPFAGHVTITEANPRGYTDFLRSEFPGAGGKCDLVAYFFRRAFNLLRTGGALGLIATKTIRQGDTRDSGLRWICLNGGTIFSARRRVRWPGTAAVVVSIVHIAKGYAPGPFTLDGKEVKEITAYLFHSGGSESPDLVSHGALKTFQGSVIRGKGFLFDDGAQDATPLAEMNKLIELNPKNKDIIRPFLGGEDLNNSPNLKPTRYVIDFGEMPLADAGRWPELLEIVRNKVLTQRKKSAAKSSTGRVLEHWWQFGHIAKELYQAIRSFDQVLAIAQTSNTLAFAFVPTNCVLAQTLVVFSTESWEVFTTLQSRVHQEWALFFAATMKDDARYIPTDCFSTFPFPDRIETRRELAQMGRRYYEYRNEVMTKNEEGLTQIYNRFHDPDEADPGILKIRKLHAEMDSVVLDAYGWTDIPTECDFFTEYEADEADLGARKKRYRFRWPDEIRDEVLLRLLELNRFQHEMELKIKRGAN